MPERMRAVDTIGLKRRSVMPEVMPAVDTIGLKKKVADCSSTSGKKLELKRGTKIVVQVAKLELKHDTSIAHGGFLLSVVSQV